MLAFLSMVMEDTDYCAKTAPCYSQYFEHHPLKMVVLYLATGKKKNLRVVKYTTIYMLVEITSELEVWKSGFFADIGVFVSAFISLHEQWSCITSS